MLIVSIAGLVLVILSITLASAILEGRLARNAIEEASRLKGFAESSSEGLAFLSAGSIVDANERFWSMAGYDPSCPPSGLAIFDLLAAPSIRVLLKRDVADFVETELCTTDGAGLPVEVALCRTQVRGKPQDLIIIRDVSSRKAAAARFAHLASHDPLTGAVNRYAFNDTLDHAIATAAQGADPVAVLLIAVDRTDDIHARYGHEAGDAILIEVTSRIRDCMRETDVLARLSDDQFAVIQIGDGQPRQSAGMADRMLASLGEGFIVEGRERLLDARIGIALYPGDASSRSDLYRCASLALQRAKAAEVAGYRFFEAAIDQLLIARRELESDLRGAIEAGQLHLHYQPLACSVTGKVVGFEALLRWQHPVHGNIPPDSFIPMAEEIGAIVSIGRWVLQEACAEAVRWAEPLRIAVNLSPVQFAAGDLVATVERVLIATGLSPARLDLEITEGVLINDLDNVLPILSAVKSLGVGISMDDFGTGYSSLAYFWKFPFDKVKIDRAFVGDMIDHPKAMAIVKMVIGLGKSLGLTTVAEGVETRAQAEALQALGCDQLQGYLVGRPAPSSHFRPSAAGRNVEDFTCSSVCHKCPAGHSQLAAHNDLMPTETPGRSSLAGM
jgi:diguanylate cyclase (GGDEF)-like protein